MESHCTGLELSADVVRLDALETYAIMDTAPEQAFDDITELAKQICDTPIATITFVDSKRQWFKSRVGLKVDETPLNASFCVYAMAQEDVFLLPDALQAEPFRSVALSANPPYGFYAGAPLRSLDGHALGSLAVMDHRPRQLDEAQIGALRSLARQVMTHLELRRALSLHRQAEQEQRNLAKRLSLALDGADLGDWEWDPTTDLISLSPRACQIFGLTTVPAQVTRSEMRGFLEEEYRDLTRVASNFAEVNQQDYDIEYQIRRRNDGQKAWVAARGRGIYGPDGLQKMLGILQDITARKTVEASLRASDNRSRLLADLSERTRDIEDPEEVMATIAEMVGRHLGISRCAYAEVEDDEDNFVIPRDFCADGVPSLTGRYQLSLFDELIKSQQLAGITTVIHDVRQQLGSQGAGDLEALGVRALICCPLIRNGHLRALMAVHHANPRDWSEEEVALVQAVAERCWAYIERARADRLATERERLFRLVANAIPQLAWMARPDGAPFWYNQRWLRYADEKFQENGGWLSLIHSSERVAASASYQKSVQAQESWEATFRLLRLDGQYRWHQSRALPMKDDQGVTVLWFGTHTDITEQRQALLERESLLASERAARGEAERASRMKDEFLATLSHELRTPMHAILGWAQMLQKGMAGLDLSEGLEIIERNARTQTQIIDDLLDMSKIVAGKVKLKIQTVEVAEILVDALATVIPSLEAKGIAVVGPRWVGPQRPALLAGDPIRLRQVFWNLLNNAVKFTPCQGSLTIELESRGEGIEIRIQDSGEGIGADFLPYIFDRFRQADSSITRRFGGLGLGLAIVKQLVELHGGEVAVESQGPGLGACFSVRLPLSSVATLALEESRATFEDRTAIDLTGIRILVLDDEADARALARRILESHHAQVSELDCAEEVIATLLTFAPHVLVSDIGMPGEDGYSMIGRVRALNGEQGGATPALALTAYARPEDRVRALAAGFQKHLSKPFEAQEFLAAVASLAGR